MLTDITFWGLLVPFFYRDKFGLSLVCKNFRMCIASAVHPPNQMPIVGKSILFYKRNNSYLGFSPLLYSSGI